ncbi:hypothetical protein [Tenacibaculum piscium]|uniref:hypothetical protein n=1 Tax=Tenacibaculum piscium TaxID=1458515 RepID=UPI001F256013|nr:hypothetical protein [Tenacibaculum piscium]
MILSITTITFWLIPVLIIMSIYSIFKYQLSLLSEHKNNDASDENLNENLVTAQNILAKRVKENDLKIVAGINPKIEGLFHAFGIETWEDLGETSVEKCQKILKSVGNRYKILKPKTWPKQAKLAHQGKWEELQQWQGELTAQK